MSQPPVERLLEWYGVHARDLPWRKTRDPYRIWVSEIMLQQTRVETVLPYYLQWMDSFPDVHSLAAASREEVLRHWEGLGYYRRAHMLHEAARQLAEKREGNVPQQVRALRELPGIGEYTAAAIASMAFGADEAAVDGNVRRVITRLFNLETDPRTSEGRRRVRELAQNMLPKGRAGEFNQALMDLGSRVCTPRNPRCRECPLQDGCQAYAAGVQEQRPVRSAKDPAPHKRVTAAVITRRGEVLLGQRKVGGLLGGLWEFPGGTVEDDESLEACVTRELQEELGVEVNPQVPLGSFDHAYSHFSVTLHAYACDLTAGEPQALAHEQVRWVPLRSLDDYPMGKLDRLIAERVQRKHAGDPG